MPLRTSSCPLYPKLIKVSVGMIPDDHPTFMFFCGPSNIVKQNRSAQSGSTPLCRNVPQPMDNAQSPPREKCNSCTKKLSTRVIFLRYMRVIFFCGKP